MNRTEKRTEILACLRNNGFSRAESRQYLRSIKLEAKERRNTRLVRNGGIRRVRI